MRERFAQLQADTVTFSATVLVSKKGKVTIKKKPNRREGEKGPDLSHNRTRTTFWKRDAGSVSDRFGSTDAGW